ncbi:OB-fold nucleic acid binding domain-containing protein [Anaerophilus nitritogenes]|uniref:helix-hairpin-helix domain-containing protein n=1 Tax=Anaerophilus nitritogenes TaxID=2498136 RepID=UPI00101BD22D|nr:OB-fold nucleic acid binding domain-containing protein [Anaerophilus nitritogenes]
MAALLTSVMGDSTKIAQYIEDCKKRNIEILPPSANDSRENFTVEDGKIRFGLLAVKNVGLGVIDSIVKEREEKGKYLSFTDFCEKIDMKEINKRAVDSLIRAGAFDGMGANRAQLLAIYEKVMDGISQDRKRNIAGQVSLFQVFDTSITQGVKKDELPDVAEFPQKNLLIMEKEVLGLYISGHPLSEYEEEVKKISTLHTIDLLEIDENQSQKIKDGGFIRIAGLIIHRKNKITKNNNMMSFITLEDLFGSIEILVFPKIFDQYMNFLQEDQMVIIEGKITLKEDEEPKIIANKILPLTKNAYTNDMKLYLKISKEKDEKEVFQKIKKILGRWRGMVPVYIYIEKENKKLKADTSLWIHIQDELIEELKKILGEECVKTT